MTINEMSLKEVAAELVSGCREGRAKENLDKLYAENAVSVEAADMGQGRETEGVDAIRQKQEWWENTFDVLDSKISDPYPHGDDKFAVLFAVTTRNKETGEEHSMEEVAVYHVADGCIFREEFFYPTG